MKSKENVKLNFTFYLIQISVFLSESKNYILHEDLIIEPY